MTITRSGFRPGFDRNTNGATVVDAAKSLIHLISLEMVHSCQNLVRISIVRAAVALGLFCNICGWTNNSSLSITIHRVYHKWRRLSLIGPISGHNKIILWNVLQLNRGTYDVVCYKIIWMIQTEQMTLLESLGTFLKSILSGITLLPHILKFRQLNLKFWRLNLALKSLQ